MNLGTRGENIVEETRAVNFGKILEKAEQVAATAAKEAAEGTRWKLLLLKKQAAIARLAPIKKIW